MFHINPRITENSSNFDKSKGRHRNSAHVMRCCRKCHQKIKLTFKSFNSSFWMMNWKDFPSRKIRIECAGLARANKASKRQTWSRPVSWVGNIRRRSATGSPGVIRFTCAFFASLFSSFFSSTTRWRGDLKKAGENLAMYSKNQIAGRIFLFHEIQLIQIPRNLQLLFCQIRQFLF